MDISGLAVTLVDTAGWRETVDVVEREGVARSARARGIAELVVVVLDRSEPLAPEDEELLAQTGALAHLVVANKSDLPPAVTRPDAIAVSAATGDGLDALRCAIEHALTGRESRRDAPPLANIRHIALLEQARAHLVAAAEAASRQSVPEEFVLSDLQAAREKLDEIVGRRTSEDVLRHIFERFCIGK